MKKAVLVLFVLIFLSSLSFSVSAQENESLSLDTYLDKVYETIPEEVEELLPKDKIGDTVSPTGMISVIEAVLNRELKSTVYFLATLLITVFLVILTHTTTESFSIPIPFAGSVSQLALLTFLMTHVFEAARSVLLYCQKTEGFLGSVNAVLSSLLFLGGNAKASVGISGGMATIALLLEKGIYHVLMPTVSLSLIGTVGLTVLGDGLSSVGKVARNIFQWLIGIVSFFTVLIMTSQSILSASEDSLSAKTIRFAISSSIPIVGGAVGDSLSTLSSSIDVIRKTVGTLGVLGILILMLYPLVSLFAMKLSVYLCEELSLLFSVSSVSILLGEIRKLLNMLIAVSVIVSLLSIFALSLYMLIPIAIGGV